MYLKYGLIRIEAALQTYHQLKSYPSLQPLLLRLVMRLFTHDLPGCKLPDGTEIRDVKLKKEFAEAWRDGDRYDLMCVTGERVMPNKLLRCLIVLHGWASQHLSVCLVSALSFLCRILYQSTNRQPPPA